MNARYKISADTAALLGLACAGATLFLDIIPIRVPLLVAFALGGASLVLALLGLRSDRWRFKCYAACALICCIWIFGFLLHPAPLARWYYARPRERVPASVTFDGTLTQDQAEYAYAWTKGVLRQSHWYGIRQDLKGRHFSHAWRSLQQGPPAVLRLSAPTNGAVTVFWAAPSGRTHGMECRIWWVTDAGHTNFFY